MGERRALAYLGVFRELWGGLPPQRSDHVEDAVNGGVVGLVDGECLLGQVFVFVGIFLMRNENSGSDSHVSPCPEAVPTSTPLLKLCPQPVTPVDPRLRFPHFTMKRLKVTVISCPASVHHVRV